MKPQRLSIDSEVFTDLREKFDAVMNMAIMKMQNMSITEGTITAKCKINLLETRIDDLFVKVPVFTCDVDMSLPIKGKVEAHTPKGIQIHMSDDGTGFIVAGLNVTIDDIMEECKREAEA